MNFKNFPLQFSRNLLKMYKSLFLLIIFKTIQIDFVNTDLSFGFELEVKHRVPLMKDNNYRIFFSNRFQIWNLNGSQKQPTID